VDRSFIATMGSDDSSHSIVKAVIALAHTLNLSVIAEGVETQEQVDLLCAAGCNSAQGYFFAKPLPANQVINYLNAKRQREQAISA
jgi:sensor c-di-GMP phosphodiesterase-like protein